VRELAQGCAVLYKEQEPQRLARIGSPASLKALEKLNKEVQEFFNFDEQFNKICPTLESRISL
jgi:hypothetical protein